MSRRLPQHALPSLYARLAPIYDLGVPALSSRARALALDWLDVADGERVVNVAVGTGLAIQSLVKQNPSGRTLGIDRSAAMLHRAHGRLADAPPEAYALRLGDARRLRLPPSTVDALLCGYLLDVLPRRVRHLVLAECRRVLRPGGRLVAYHLTRPTSPAGRAWSALVHACPPALGGARPVAATPALRNAGFVSLRRTTVTQRGLPTEVLSAETPACAASPQ